MRVCGRDANGGLEQCRSRGAPFEVGRGLRACGLEWTWVRGEEGYEEDGGGYSGVVIWIRVVAIATES